MKKFLRFLLPGGEIFTPRGLLTRALVLVVFFAVFHLAGLRSHTSILTGTFAEAGVSRNLFASLGVAYVLLYSAFVLVVPVLLIASLLLHLFLRHRKVRREPSSTAPES